MVKLKRPLTSKTQYHRHSTTRVVHVKYMLLICVTSNSGLIKRVTLSLYPQLLIESYCVLEFKVITKPSAGIVLIPLVNNVVYIYQNNMYSFL